MICEGITCPQSGGLGGGFLLTIYIKENNSIETLDAREVAPKLATKHMFDGKVSESLIGGLAVAVPGELKGLWELHQKYGKLPWKDLMLPNIELCRNGYQVQIYFHNSMKFREDRILASPTLSEVFINPKTNQVWNTGDLIKRIKLADSLEIIANEGASAIYNGTLTKILVNDIQKFGGIITEEDFLDYRVRWGEPEIAQLNENHTLYTSPLPGSGPVLAFILNILKGYELKKNALSYHRIIEAFKFAYGRRTLLGDEPLAEVKELVKNLTSSEFADFIRSKIDDEKTYSDFDHYGAIYESVNDQGTANVCILAPNGDAVVGTSTINYSFGAYRASAGILLNNEMDDFALPGRPNIYGLRPSPANFIIPGNRPLSSMTPTIILDKNGDVRMLVGASGGSRITTSVALFIISHLIFGESIESSIKAPRLHHQITPMELFFETGFDASILNELQYKYLNVVTENTTTSDFAAITSIVNVMERLDATFDPRRGGNKTFF